MGGVEPIVGIFNQCLVTIKHLALLRFVTATRLYPYGRFSSCASARKYSEFEGSAVTELDVEREEKIGGTDRSPFEHVYRSILRRLYEGSFVPGQRLVAPDLMREYGVGRGTIREILQRLASTGVVTIEPNKGARVRRLTRTETAGLLDIVEVLLGLAARGAARAVASTAAKDELRSLYHAMKRIDSNADFQGFLRARERYYRFIVAASNSSELQRVFPTTQVQIMRAQLRSFDRAGDSAELSDYTDLNRAILSGNEELAELAGRAHVKKTMNRVLALPDRAFEPDH